MNYTVAATQVKKVTITITRKQLWDNYMDCWNDIAWDALNVNASIEGLRKVQSVLVGDSMDFLKIRALFRDGDTVLLMGSAMQFIDTGEDILREVIVTDTLKTVTVYHQDIIF